MIEERSKALALAWLLGLLYFAAVPVAAYLTPAHIELWRGIWWRWLYFLGLGIWDGAGVQVLTAANRAALGWLGVAIVAPLVAVVWVRGLFPWRLGAYGGMIAGWARLADLRPLSWRYGIKLKRRPEGGIVVGKFRGRYVVVTGPYWVMLFGPAGEGKTAGCIVPSVAASDGRSLVVNDPSGEICRITRGRRLRQGRVVRLEWMSDDSDGFNPLDLRILPADTAGRGDHCDKVAETLIPSNGKNEFYSNSGRLALAAGMLFCVYAAEERGESTNIGAVSEWFARLGQKVSEEGETEDYDSVRTRLLECAQEAEAKGWPARIAEGLLELGNMVPETRSNVTATIAAELKLWKNERVRAATSRCDFLPDDLRGVDGRPITVYLVTPPAQQERLGKINGLLVELCYDALTRREPRKGSWLARLVGRVAGRPARGADLWVTFVLDELKFFPKLKAVEDGPSILRKYLVNGIIGFQDRGQIEGVYGRHALSGFDQNVVARVLFTLGHLETAEWAERLIGKRWALRRQGRSSQWDATNVAAPRVTNNKSMEGVSLISAQEVMSLQAGQQLVIFRSAPHRPVLARSPYWFRDRAVKRRLPGAPVPAKTAPVPVPLAAAAGGDAAPERPAAVAEPQAAEPVSAAAAAPADAPPAAPVKRARRVDPDSWVPPDEEPDPKPAKKKPATKTAGPKGGARRKAKAE